MKLGFAKAATIAAIPVLFALGIGAWLGASSAGSSSTELEQARREEVSAQSRLLVDSVWSAIETIQSKAQALAQVRKSGAVAAPSGVILHWAELAIEGGKITAARQSARNPSWQPGPAWESAEAAYLQDAIWKLNLAELQSNGVAILRVKQDPGRPNEWLALAFQGADSASLVLALVDPAEAFPMFRRWGKRSEGGNLRAYLVGADGYVLAHSQKSYVASDFSAAPVFDGAVRAALTSDRISGVSDSSAIDRLPVTAAYARTGTLPLAVVVERVAIQARAPLWARIPYDTALAGLGGLLALTLLAAYLLRRGAPAPAESEAEPAFESLVESEIRQEELRPARGIDLSIQEIRGGAQPDERALGTITVPGSGVSVPVIAGKTSADAIAEALIAASQRPAPAEPKASAPAPAPTPRAVAMPAADAAPDMAKAARSTLTQMILDAELRSAVARGRADAASAAEPAPIAGPRAPAGASAIEAPGARRAAPARDPESAFAAEMTGAPDPRLQEDRAERLLIAQFENEALRLKDPKKIAYRLAQLMSSYSGCPALYFGYHEGLRAAILGAQAGFAPGQAPQAMSFPINDPILSRIMRYEREGKPASLSDYAPLMLLLSTRLKSAHCEAWAVTGSGSPPLLGVLVLVGAQGSRGASLARVMKTTGLIYESAILNQ